MKFVANQDSQFENLGSNSTHEEENRKNNGVDGISRESINNKIERPTRLVFLLTNSELELFVDACY